jgi:hypothetical protein
MARYGSAEDLLDALRDAFEDDELLEALFKRVPLSQLEACFHAEIAELSDEQFLDEEEEDLAEDDWLSSSAMTEDDE